MITPRRTRLVRVPDLHRFRRTIVHLALSAATGHRPTLVVVPSGGAARGLRRAGIGSGPRLVTRDQLYDELHGSLHDPPRRLTAFERDAMMQAAAQHAADTLGTVPYRLRPGLVSEIMRFYDLLRRQSQHVSRFESLLADALGPLEGDHEAESSSDPGSARMWAQTRFLAESFRAYEARVLASGACDEHLLRARLFAEPAGSPFDRVVVTVADWIAEPEGLFVADFDLLTRLPGLAAIDLVCTEGALASGFHERLHLWWPGLEEVEASALWDDGRPAGPSLLAPARMSESADRPWFTFRDREEELVDVARRLAEGARGSASPAGERAAVVFKRPLPYLYLAPGTLGAAGIPYQTSSALPLAGEPAAAALDLMLDLVESDFSRSAIAALLDSPHFAFASVAREMVAALNRSLSRARYLGDPSGLDAFRDEADRKGFRPALDAVVALASELGPLRRAGPISCQLRLLAECFEAHASPIEQMPGGDEPAIARALEARRAVRAIIDRCQTAHAAHHDPACEIDEVAATLRRWIGEETFAAEAGKTGVQLMDDQTARYSEVDDLTVVGLVEQDWPETPRPNIFYPPSVLKALGWPAERDRRAAADARFLDLLASPARQVALSTFLLDGDRPATPSILLDEVTRAHLAILPRTDVDEPMPSLLSSQVSRAWTTLRDRRPPADDPAFHGQAGASATPAKAWSVSAVETYLGCPFKFYSEHVLALEDEPDDEEVLDPRTQGRIVHRVFEEFFREWQRSGRRAITIDNLPEARDLFATVVDAELGGLSEAEAALERTRLLGSPAAAGLGEAVFRMEAERPEGVLERLLEWRLTAPLTIVTDTGTRVVTLGGKADRIDLLDAGTFRVIDYKLGWAPDRNAALQLAVYGLWAQQQLTRERGTRWTLGEAAYLAFKGPRRVVPLFTNADDRDAVLSRAQQRLADALDGIAAGRFPPSPDDVFRCETCRFAAVCRKDYVGDV